MIARKRRALAAYIEQRRTRYRDGDPRGEDDLSWLTEYLLSRRISALHLRNQDRRYSRMVRRNGCPPGYHATWLHRAYAQRR